jgi:hypothetical protein
MNRAKLGLSLLILVYSSDLIALLVTGKTVAFGEIGDAEIGFPGAALDTTSSLRELKSLHTITIIKQRWLMS